MEQKVSPQCLTYSSLLLDFFVPQNGEPIRASDEGRLLHDSPYTDKQQLWAFLLCKPCAVLSLEQTKTNRVGAFLLWLKQDTDQ